MIWRYLAKLSATRLSTPLNLYSSFTRYKFHIVTRSRNHCQTHVARTACVTMSVVSAALIFKAHPDLPTVAGAKGNYTFQWYPTSGESGVVEVVSSLAQQLKVEVNDVTVHDIEHGLDGGDTISETELTVGQIASGLNLAAEHPADLDGLFYNALLTGKRLTLTLYFSTKTAVNGQEKAPNGSSKTRDRSTNHHSPEFTKEANYCASKYLARCPKTHLYIAGRFINNMAERRKHGMDEDITEWDAGWAECKYHVAKAAKVHGVSEVEAMQHIKLCGTLHPHPNPNPLSQVHL